MRIVVTALRVVCFCVLVFFQFCGSVSAAPIDTLQLKADWNAVVRDAEDTLLGRRFAERVASYLVQANSWKASLPQFEGVSDVIAEGGSLRLITWAHPTALREWLHMGLIVKPNREGGVMCIPLSDRQLPVKKGLIEDDWLTARGDARSWVGAVYFRAKSFVYQRDTSYLLIGVAGRNAFVARRVIETLHITPDGTVNFGLPLIAQGEKRLGRILVAHSARVGMEINFVEGRQQVLMDHLSPASLEYAGMPSYYGPDFSYDALELSPSGLWVFTMNVDPKAFSKKAKRKPGQNAVVGRGDKRVGSYKANWKK